MRMRTTVIFWSTVLTSVLLLGGGLSTVRHGAGGAGDAAVLMVSTLGAVAALGVAARIVWVFGRAQRAGRRR